MHPDDKRRFQERTQREFKHWHTFDEQKRRKEEARRRKAERAQRPRPRTRGAPDEDEEPGTEPTTGRPQPARARASVPAPAPEVDERPALALECARVVGLARTRATLATEGETLEAALVPGLELAIGDRVGFERLAGGLVRVRAREPRTSVFARPDPSRPGARLVLAANVELVLAVVAARAPRWKPGFVDRVWLAASEGGAACALVLNKLDLVTAEERAELEGELAPYRELGLAVVRVSVASGTGLAELAELLRGRSAVFVGPSGVGKSSLQNALDPLGARATGAVRASDGKGRHTTTASEWRRLADGTVLIDTPGVRQFGLAALDGRELAAAFPEFAGPAAHCRFRDCSHLVEPGCGVQAALATGALDRRRFASYARMRAALA